MERDLNAIPATMGDVVQLLAIILNEIMDQATLDAKDAGEAVTNIANNLDALGKNTSNARARLLLVAMAQRLKLGDKVA